MFRATILAIITTKMTKMLTLMLTQMKIKKITISGLSLKLIKRNLVNYRAIHGETEGHLLDKRCGISSRCINNRSKIMRRPNSNSNSFIWSVPSSSTP